MAKWSPRRRIAAVFSACALGIVLCFALPFGVFAAWDSALERNVHARTAAAPQLSAQGRDCPLALALYTQVQQYGTEFSVYQTSAKTIAQLPAAVLAEIDAVEQAGLLPKTRDFYGADKTITFVKQGALTAYTLHNLQVKTEEETGKLIALSWVQAKRGSITADALADDYLAYLGLQETDGWEAFSIPLTYEGTENAVRYHPDLQLYLAVSIGQGIDSSRAYYNINLKSLAPQQAEEMRRVN